MVESIISFLLTGRTFGASVVQENKKQKKDRNTKFFITGVVFLNDEYTLKDTKISKKALRDANYVLRQLWTNLIINDFLMKGLNMDIKCIINYEV